jgi:hypothetical protein
VYPHAEQGQYYLNPVTGETRWEHPVEATEETLQQHRRGGSGELTSRTALDGDVEYGTDHMRQDQALGANGEVGGGDDKEPTLTRGRAASREDPPETADVFATNTRTSRSSAREPLSNEEDTTTRRTRDLPMARPMEADPALEMDEAGEVPVTVRIESPDDGEPVRGGESARRDASVIEDDSDGY